MNLPPTQREMGQHPTPGLIPPWGKRGRVAAPVAGYCVWLNGELVPYDDETVRAMSPTVSRGPALFEEIRCYPTERGPAIFRLRDHLLRFVAEAARLGLRDLRYTIHDLQRAANVAVHANNFRSCRIRLVLYLVNPDAPGAGEAEPVVAVAAWEPAGPPHGTRWNAGAKAKVTPFATIEPILRRLAREENEPTLGAWTARQHALRGCFDVAIILDSGGAVAAGTVENLFLVSGDTIEVSPQPGRQADVARDTLLTLAAAMGYRIVEAALSQERLTGADELFFCGTTTEVIPLVALNSRPVGRGEPGPHTRALQARYADTVRGRSEPTHGWLEYVMMEPLY